MHDAFLKDGHLFNILFFSATNGSVAALNYFYVIR